MQIYPYVRYGATDYNKQLTINSCKCINLFSKKEDFLTGSSTRLNIYLTIENMGLHNLINFTILEVECLEKSPSGQVLGHIKVDEKIIHHMYIEIIISDEDDIYRGLIKKGMTVKVAYCNIMGDYYEQDIKISFSNYVVDALNEICQPEITQDNVSKPKFFYKDIF